MFKVNNKDTKTAPGVMSLFLVLNICTPCSSASIVKFEQVNVGWELR